jgi:drug/metabolite transporter (DMT)-like permease
VIFGLAAAFGWGLGDLWAGMAGRRIGSSRTLVVAQVSVAIVATLLVIVVRPDLSGLPEVVPWLVPAAFLGAAAYATLYRGLELGPIAVVSPVLATYAVLPVFLSVVLLDESLGAVEWAGAAITIAGAVLTSTDLRALRGGSFKRFAGLPWAIASTLLFGVATYVLGWSAKEAGFLASMWFARGTLSIVVVVVAALFVWVRSNRRSEVPVQRSPSALRLAALAGVVELLGTMVYARGAEVGLVSIVTAASATYPFIPVLGGVVLLHERLVPNQYAGVALVVAGLMLLALG